MAMSKSFRDRVAKARQLEQDGQFTEAAGIYQQLFDADPRNQEVLDRLLVIYRKQKEYRKELKVIDAAIAAFEQQEKAFRDKWLKAHPKAASAGRSILRQLERGGGEAYAQGEDPVVSRWRKRRALVEKRITGKKGKTKSGGAKRKGESKAAVEKAWAAAERKAMVAAEKAKAVTERREKAAARRKQKAEARRAADDARREAAEARRAAAEDRQHPSLFVIILRYLVSLEKIDALMPRHVAYLNKHYATGDFLVSGRQVPRTGGIIIARGKDRDAVEQLVKADPFVKQKLASADIIEFKASQVGKGLERWLSIGGKKKS